MKRMLLCALLFAAPAPGWADEDGDEEAGAIAQRYGMDRLDAIEALKFTFNVRRGTTTLSRAWTWEPAADRVSVATVEGERPFKHSYSPSRMKQGDAPLNEKVDRWFVNDRYWLLFPHHLVHDRAVELTFDANEPLPIPPGSADRLTITYADNVGYTPGDIYEIYYGVDHLIRQWVFRKAGAEKPSLVSTWEDHARIGPVVASLRHRSADGSFELWFSDVEGRLKGSKAWVEPVPLK